MVREILVNAYLIFFRIGFTLFNLFPQKKKTVFVASFGDNVLYVENALKKCYEGNIVILSAPECRVNFKLDFQTDVIPFDLKRHPIQFIKSIYHISTCRHVFIDNYFGFLAAAKFRKNVKCVQLWHAAGAVKRFGLKDPSTKYRSAKAQARFKKVYQTFDHVVVGSEKMAAIFKESFGLADDRMLRTGVPRTDFFYDKNVIERVESSLHRQYPILQNKKVILYAPTFRDHQLTNPNIQLNLQHLYEELNEEFVLLMRLHPAVKANLSNSYPDFVIDVSSYPNMNELLVVTDILITDYSSIPYEFSILERPMIFYSYDLEEYKRARGFWEDYHSTIPGPVVSTTQDIIEIIKRNDFNMEQIKQFSQQWNHYSNGNSSRQLIEKLY
ncbi:CDP-glycerol glycerophosphotransferase family protein [Thalassobacillus devorans]|uniref:CDP-glycerol glycerophosphotransferase family protein n=1 Tax=Thalassobacillus devorans TaxID=279813 RepID=UPI00048C4938|nr:CDP-glycerol glycerophosphotransferase family protein [Thalassobacillus devorans]